MPTPWPALHDDARVARLFCFRCALRYYGNGTITAADLIGEALEIDGDGDFWADVVNGTFVGSPMGCDANDDTLVNAGDISCTILLIFGGNCGGAPLAGPMAERGFEPESSPVLGLSGKLRRERGRLWIPVLLSSGHHALWSVAFSLDLGDGVAFDPFDGDGDGLPDAVRFPGARPDLVEVRYSAKDRGGALDLALADFGSALSDGVLIEIAIEPLRRGALRSPARFAESPGASFGDLFGRSVPGRAIEVSDL